MVFLGLGMVTHKDVGRQATIGDDATNDCHTVKIPLTGVLAVHQLQDTVRTALHRQVDMLADIGYLGNDTQRLIAHILGV